ncbi:MAG: citramalate synthase [Eubacteriales bacterium]|nr:citramalate synthase [Eubacteriales bacterium]
MAKRIEIFDSTLRDGAQARGINYSLSDKIYMLGLLDSLGIDYIEAGNPASNPKERLFFEQAVRVSLKNAKLVAFGSTRRKNTDVKVDAGVKSLMDAGTDVVAVFGKAWDLHATDVIGTTLEENLCMIYDTVRYLKESGREVIFDAEHYFDGFKANSGYALDVVRTACRAGAGTIALCDTNGGTMPRELEEAIKAAMEAADVKWGIHVHNDSELAVANTILAVQLGTVHVQGTLLGYGERCGNARLSSIIPGLQLKLGYDCIGDHIKDLYHVAREAAEITNLPFDETLPYVGRNAFAHKGGMHIDGLCKAEGSFEHIEPSLVGNSREYLLSEVAGKSAMATKLEDEFPEVAKDKKKVGALMERLKDLENEGYSFEGAESSFRIFVMKELGLHKSKFSLVHFKVSDEPTHENTFGAYAVVKVNVNGENRMAAAEGNGPVNALDKALREALGQFFPELKSVTLTDYKVRVLDTNAATGAKVRVVIESSDGENYWHNMGVSTDVIEASLFALIDSIDHLLLCKKD